MSKLESIISELNNLKFDLDTLHSSKVDSIIAHIEQEEEKCVETITLKVNRPNIVPYDPKYKAIRLCLADQTAVYWTVRSVAYHNDRVYFKPMPPTLKKAIKLILGFFVRADYIVSANLKKWLNKITIPEIRKAYSFQDTIEEEHAEMYGLLVEEYFEDEQEREELFNAIDNMPVVKAKGEWAIKWMNSQKSLAHVIVAFACVEGVHFQSAFSFIDWLKELKYKLQYLYDSNNYISRDEAQHCKLAGLVYQLIDYPISLSECADILKEAYSIECMFIDELIIAEGYTGMNRQMMKEHCRHACAIVANLLSPPSINYKSLYANTQTPFAFMIKRSLDNKSNFFEQEDQNYLVSSNKDQEKRKFTTKGKF